jgi:polyribonucleotide nucleotidyltransferase
LNHDKGSGENLFYKFITIKMGQKIPISTSFNLPDGREVTIETGKLATQADGSVVVRMGNTMLFASVVSAKEAREGPVFLSAFCRLPGEIRRCRTYSGQFFQTRSSSL